jgi:lipopolysaccharide/colanic/teichoic acid biosynthesis glycosyltransferase
VIKIDGGQIFFTQDRLGFSGKHFKMWKFRSMIPNADECLLQMLEQDEAQREYWEIWRKLPNDPRTTRVGAWLRRLSLDELPQLWNVFKGDMSLVGPRPILLSEAVLWKERLSIYEEVRPGITGLWQVSGRSRLSYEERIILDLQYIAHRSVYLDTRILIRTIGVVFALYGAH